MINEKGKPLVMPETLAECELVMERLSADCTAIRSQVDAARAGVKTHGRYADAGWFHRANTALRWMNRDRQRLQDHMGKLRRSEKRERSPRLEDELLIAALREHVTSEVFQACVDKTRALAGGEYSDLKSEKSSEVPA